MPKSMLSPILTSAFALDLTYDRTINVGAALTIFGLELASHRGLGAFAV